jgi:anaerobic selenocysteine-containing dehydrogenase
VIEGLKREDLFTVVHDVVLTDTVDYADIVLPAPTFLETEDLYFSYGQYYLQWATPAIQPLGEAKSNWELFSVLAKKMGFEEAVFQEGAEKIIEDLVDNDLCREMGIGKNELSDFRGHRVGFPRDENPFKDGFFTPSGKLEFYSETLAQGGLDPLPDHVPLAEGSETPAVLKKYPLQLIVPPIHHFLNSCFGEVEDCIFAERKPYLFIHPEDAVSRGIEEGDLVKVFNDRGENYRFAKVGERALPGVAVTEGIWWTKLSPGRKGTNQLTSERLTDLGRAAPLHSNLVEVEKVESNVAQALLEDYPQAAI